MLINSFTRLAIITFITVSLISCSKETIKPEVRAVERWNALIEEDWEKAYSFQTPNYRKTYDSQAYRNSFGSAVDWKSVKLISAQPTSDSITEIKLEVQITFAEGGASLMIPSVVNERWQLIDNQWWFVKK